ncbi:MAG: AMP-binding protein [Bdellovibrio sp.]|nr:AMP-binding protein [Bdellovibrio sp.]
MYNFWNYSEQFLHEEKKGVSFVDRNGSITFWSYQTLVSKSLETARDLESAGVCRGDHVALVLPNGPDFVRLFLGAMLCEAVPCALYPPLILGKIDEYLIHLEKQLLMLKPKVLITIKALKAPLYGPLTKLASAVNLLIPEECQGREKLCPDWSKSRDSRQPAFIQFSSGTTGVTRPAVVTHANLQSNLESISEGLKVIPGVDSGVSWLPLYHDMGLVGSFFSALCVKSNMALIRPEDFLARPALWLESISKNRATITVAPNFAYGLTAKRVSEEELRRLDLSSLRVALCGAEQVSRETMEIFIERFRGVGLRPEALMPVYGMSEATLALTFPKLGHGARFKIFEAKALATNLARQEAQETAGATLASVGFPIKNVEIKVLDQDGSVLPERQVGNIWAKGPAIIERYLHAPLDKRDGFFSTGDRGFIFDGELYIAGRAKDILIVRGRNVDAETAEAQLYDFKELRVGRWAIRATLTEENYLLAEIRSPLTLDQEENLKNKIKARLLEQLSLPLAHIAFVAPGSLPRTSSGKIQREKALSLYLQGKLRPPKTGFWSYLLFLFYSLKGFMAFKLGLR